MAEARVAILGGSGLYEMDGLTGMHEVMPETPYGPPSDTIMIGDMAGVATAFLPRHGRGHRMMPTELPVRANIYALKTLGVERVISISAVGSLDENVHPMEMVVPNQLIDRTRQRANTFFGDGLVAHVSFADPFCATLSAALSETAKEVGATVHEGGTYVVMEGPAFSTRAESLLYRSWGAKVIGMTALPEAKLAREAEMCYATLACATDYDSWRESEEPVSVEMVIANLSRNIATSKEILQRLVPRLTWARTCRCESALGDAIITDRDAIPREIRRRLAPLVGRYLDDRTND